MKNFFVLHKSGKTYFSKNFLGEALDQSLVVGFSSSVSNFCRTSFGEDIREVVPTKSRVVYKFYGDFVFVAHSDLATGSTVVQAVLRDVGSMCEFLFGSHEYWDDDFFDLTGSQDIISQYFSKVGQDPCGVVGGVSQIFIEPEVCDRLDKLLAFLESQEGVCGHATMLVLGDSILHSRFGLHESRMILQLNKVRPLGYNSVRYTPVFCNGTWSNLYMIRIQSYVLAVLTFIDRSYASFQRKVDEFRMAFLQSRLEIPAEEPPVLLRLFAKRETLAMLYHNIKTGHTIFPQLRAGPEIQQKEILTSFWWFFCEASTSLNIPGVTEFSMNRDQYRFYARSEGVHKLYILLAAESASNESSAAIAGEIMKSIRAIVPEPRV